MSAKSGASSASLEAILSRLGAMGIPAYVAGERVEGRMRVSAKNLQIPEGVEFERSHAFFAHNLERIEFMEPSALRILGAMPIGELRSEADVVRRIEQRWAAIHPRLVSVLSTARGLAPSAKLATSGGGVEGDVIEEGVTVRFSLDGETATISAVGPRRLGQDVERALTFAISGGPREVARALSAAADRARQQLLAPKAEVLDVVSLPLTGPTQPDGTAMASLPIEQVVRGTEADQAGPPALYAPAAERRPPEPSRSLEPAPTLDLSPRANRSIDPLSLPPTSEAPQAPPDFGEPRGFDEVDEADVLGAASRLPEPPRNSIPIELDLSPLGDELPEAPPSMDPVAPSALAAALLGPAGLAQPKIASPKAAPPSNNAPQWSSAPPSNSAPQPSSPQPSSPQLSSPQPSSPQPSSPLPSSAAPQSSHAAPAAALSIPPGLTSDPAPRSAPDTPRYPPHPLGPYDDPFVDYGAVLAPVAERRPPPEVPARPSPVAPLPPSPAHPAAQGREFVDRPRRLIVDIPAIIAVGAARAEVRIVNLSAGGVLVAMGGLAPPPIGTVVELGAAWLAPVMARVVRHATDATGRLDGVGLAFLPDPRQVVEARGPHVLVFMPEGQVRARVIDAIHRTGIRHHAASDLLTAATAFMHLVIPAVVVDPHVRGISWVELVDALALHRRQTRVIAIEDPAQQPVSERPPWAHVVPVEAVPSILSAM